MADHVVVVLGMHRSGTSALTEALASRGLSLPRAERLLGPADSNPRGHFEDAAMVSANDWLLEQHDATWDDPWGIIGATPTPEQVGEIRRRWALIDREVDWLLVKDPRLCLTLPWWRQIWPESTRVVAIARDPAQVADSLARRNGLPPLLAELLWFEYVTSQVRVVRDMRAVWLRHDALMADPESQLERTWRILDLPQLLPGDDAIPVTIDPHLTSTVSARSPVLERAARLWSVVCGFVDRGHWEGDLPEHLPSDLADVGNCAVRALNRAELAAHEMRVARHERDVLGRELQGALDVANRAGAEAAQAKAELEAERQAKESATLRAAAAEEALAAVLGSTSWRATGPLRALGSRLRGD